MKEPIQFDNGQFAYEGSKYTIDVRFQYKIDNKENGISLSKSHINDIEMSVALNRLYSDGFIIYRDVVGDISRLIGVFDVICVVTLMKYTQEGVGDFNSEKVDDNNTLSHSFIVDNIKIVDNDNSSITYCIYLKGLEYQQLLNHVDYSDYSLDQPKTLVELVKDILVGYGKCETDDSFNKVTSGVRFHYLSNGNDTVASSLDYILQKQFFFSDNTDERMKFLMYDLMTGKYGMFQFGQSISDNMYTLFLSMNNTETEDFISSDKIKLASTSDISKTDMYIPISKLVTRTFSLEANTFAQREYESNQIIRFFGGNDDNNKIKPLMQDQTYNIVRDVSQWSNETNIYRDFVDMFMKWDSVMVNTGGVINRKLMSIVNVIVDNLVEISAGDTTRDSIENMTRYQQLTGQWFVTKIRYIIRPNKGVFKQNLRLSRCTNNPDQTTSFN